MYVYKCTYCFVIWIIVELCTSTVYMYMVRHPPQEVSNVILYSCNMVARQQLFLELYTERNLVSSPDPTLSQGKGSSDN